MSKPFTSIAIAIFVLIGVMHLIRVLFGWPITVNGADVPVWPSVVGFLVAALMAVMVWKENK